VAWAEQFPRGGGLCGACYVLYMCRRAFAGEPRVSDSTHMALARRESMRDSSRYTYTHLAALVQTTIPRVLHTSALGNQASKRLSETFLACCSTIPRHFHLAHTHSRAFGIDPLGSILGVATYTPHPFGP